MKRFHTTYIKNDSRHWVFFLALGLLFSVTGIYCFLFPLGGDVKVSHLMGFWALIAGIAKIIFSIEHKREVYRWKWQFLAGVSLIFISACLFVLNIWSQIILPFLLSFWIIAVILSLLEEATDIELFHLSDTEWILVGGILSIICLLMVAYIPILGSFTVILWTAASFFIVGFLYVYLSLRLRITKKKYHL